MSRTIVITGAGSGIGQATAARLSAKGHRIIGVDIKGADINADLGTAQGRADMIAQVKALAPDGIDGVLTSAGLADFQNPDKVIAVNYFGTIATLEGLHPLMRGPGARSVTIASAALLQQQDEVKVLEDLCLSGDEEAAKAMAREKGFLCAYPATKRALTRWTRNAASRPEWAGAGKLLNIVAPGIIETPMIAQALANPDQAPTIRANSPIAVQKYAKADDVAELMDFLLTFETGYLVGQIIFIDGGTDILMRPEHI